MANSLGTNPMVLDTAGATSVLKHNIKIKALGFVQYNADADNAVVSDMDGNEIWAPNGKSDLSSLHITSVGWVRGIQLTSITAGKVLVYRE